MELKHFIAGLQPARDSVWAWHGYHDTLRKLALALGGPETVQALEIGGGRRPAFDAQESAALFAGYTVSDISQKELNLASPHVQKLCFDIAGPDVPHTGRYDFIFSKMVFEHVRDAAQAWRNTHALLRPGGVALHFFPTLYAPPFVINRMLPEMFSRRILAFFFPGRNDGEYPKFPAYYDLCYSTEANVSRIAALGFAEAVAIPFYGHGYFQKMPLIKQADAAFSRLAEKRDWRCFSSFAYLLARK